MPETNDQTEVKPKLKRKIPVLVNAQGMIQIPTKREGDGSIVPASIIFLASGYNLVDEELWVEARKNEMVQRLMRAKIPPASAPEDNVEKVGEPYIVERKPVNADNPLAELSENHALEFVAETFALPLLKELEPQESRASIKRALRAQIDKIEKPKQAHKAERAKLEAR